MTDQKMPVKAGTKKQINVVSDEIAADLRQACHKSAAVCTAIALALALALACVLPLSADVPSVPSAAPSAAPVLPFALASLLRD